MCVYQRTAPTIVIKGMNWSLADPISPHKWNYGALFQAETTMKIGRIDTAANASAEDAEGQAANATNP